MSLSKLAIACSVALGAMTLTLAPASFAATDTKEAANAKAVKAKAKPKAKATKAKAAAKEAHPLAMSMVDKEESDEPDTAGSASTDFNCELGNKITIYTNATDDKHIALRWKKRLHRLSRVGTTTGANRFENRLYGLVWIGIPAKGMLLDSKQGRQLANECKDAEQAKPATVVEAAPSLGVLPATGG
ncbi:hypothetical protein [Janthinobacterium lividum]|uniref:hypothetical protein n=1 Tax=Janthinobacterium lividum TaxID=29581 RepID=UPI000874F423|nr:hypothetical protein [Janthinobacterium lividum]MCC7711641.1 hypothetical protein [Janthinobacterium lividum]OEZ64349.1 hypothetical protein JANLI_07990 [Janthinobacterium lividum]WQE27655.1 hypothetical protein U0004_22105 [Janthinobacterium lividum]STQ98569.1 Uncharacterised protein [Janthinobacterium lividum]